MTNTVDATTDAGVVVRLPKPPAGHYWRVYKGGLHIDHLALCKKGKLWDRKVIDTVLFFRDRNGPMEPPAVLWEAACAIMEEIAFSDEWEKYYGDYAPVK